MPIRRDPFDLTQPSRAPLWWIGTLGAIALGAVFLFAAWAKALDPEGFVAQIRAQGLELLLPAQTLAFLALALEAGLGVALLTGIRRLWVLVPTALLIVFFLFLTGRDYYRAERGLAPASASCGCFGNLVERTPKEAFWQDLGLLGIPFTLALVGLPRGGRRFPPLRTALTALVAGGAVLFAAKAPELPLDNLATRLKPGVRLADLCAGQGPGTTCLNHLSEGLDRGEHWVVLADLDTPAFTRSVPALNAWADASRKPPLVVLSSSAPERHTAFQWKFGPSFPIVDAPEALLRPLYRRLPRSFRVQDGTVTATFDGLPPLR